MPLTPFCVKPFSKSFECTKLIITTFPFVRVFYALKFLLFFSHHFFSRDLFVLFLSIGVHQVDPFVRPFIFLAHFHALCCSSKVFPSCLFPSLADDIHILSFAHIVSSIFDHFISQLTSMHWANHLAL